jgi:hypothetical protein
MDVVDNFNIFEAGLWATFALLTALYGGRVRGMTPRLRALLSASFLAFGISDLIERRTGAWWRPPGLLVYKGVCLVGIVGTCFALWMNQRVVAVPSASSDGGTGETLAPSEQTREENDLNFFMRKG